MIQGLWVGYGRITRMDGYMYEFRLPQYDFHLPVPYWGKCNCELGILSCFCALIGAKESPDVRIRVPWFGLDGLMGRDG